MKRRELLGVLGVGVAGLAGCGSSDGEEPPTVAGENGDTTPTASMPVYPFNAGSASDFEFEESDEGTVIIRVPVENTKDEPYTGELSLTVLVDGEKRTLSRTIQLDGGQSKMFPIEVETDWADWRQNFQNVTFSQGTPTGE